MSEQGSGIEVKAAGLDSETLTSNISHQEICKMVQSVATAMEKNTHFQVLSRLPMEVRKRLRALRKLQMQTSAVEMEFHEKQFELEKDFEVKHQEIFKKRFEIISGAYEPNDEECDVPDPDILKKIDENSEIFSKLKIQEGVVKADADVHADNKEEVETIAEGISASIKGIPKFWFHILYSNPTFDYLIHKDDEPILHHLIDIRTTYKLEPHFSFTLEFEFSPNPFFENLILTKEYLLKMESDDLICYEGPSIYKTIGCDIKWKAQRTSRPSIFDFFNPPVLPQNVLDPAYEEIKDLLENDFEIGDYVKDNIIPKAILYFTGEREDSDSDESMDSTSESGSEASASSVVEDQFEGEKVPK